MINSVVMVGRLGTDPELKYAQSGTPIANFRLAVERPGKGEDGKAVTDWFNVVAFQKTAEFVHQYLDKGSQVGIEGRMQSRSWKGNDGKMNYAVELVANRVQTLESKAEADRRRAKSGGSSGGSSGKPARTEPEEAALPTMDDDDPFGDD